MEILVIYIILCLIILILISVLAVGKKNQKVLENKLAAMHAKYRVDNVDKTMLIDWVEAQITTDDVADYLKAKGVNRIAVYGMSRLGIIMLHNFADAGFQEVYGVDAFPKYATGGIEIIRADQFDKKVDVVIVVTIYYFSDIYNLMKKQLGDVEIMGLDEVLYEIAGQKETN